MNLPVNQRRLLLSATLAAATLVLCGTSPAASAEAAGKIRVLIFDGQNNHNWRATTPVLRSILERGGQFAVSVATMPTGKGTDEARAAFSPPLDRYDVVLSNYTDLGGPPAPKAFLDKLAAWVSAGGGLVAVHAATAGMQHHAEYCRMVGLGWGGPARGDRLAIDASGRLVRTPKGEGSATGHGAHGPVDVTLRVADHPIVKGLPRTWRVERDELWFSARGPAEKLTVLATGYAETRLGEPVLWTVDYGRGRVFVALLGHDGKCMQDGNFQTTLRQGTRWAAGDNRKRN